ncbi:hypothetical protein LTR37_020327 [Vermiconidia calcicola]|uniref:Uncharacterized protein n=1 Tax=Vermiconidia calcicola TaxID=1690605 RepID=A0ACC3MBL8_9PEZI|nr:hypothetical protein LTR37_020327 [Vermiconidia calcicola]
MADPNAEVNLNSPQPMPQQENEQPRSPIIKEESLEEIRPWQYDPDEIIDLLTDDEDDQATSPTVPMDAEPQTSSFTGGMFDDRAEKEQSRPAKSVDQVLALQQKMANQFRARGQAKKSPAKGDGAAEFLALKKVYERKRARNEITMQEEIDFIKAMSAENARIRKKAADEEYDRSPSPEPKEGLFVSENEGAASPPPREKSDEKPAPRTKRGRKRAAAADDEGPAPKRAKKATGTGGKKAKKVPGTDYTDKDVHDVLARARADKGAKAKKANAPPKPKPKSRKRQGPEMTNLNSIFGNDVFQDTAATRNLAEQPTFTQEKGRRADALKSLIASVPSESVDVAKADKRYLDAAMKDFTGHASVTPAPGGLWHVKGMKTCLKHYQILGTAFMRRRENDAHPPKGGILADEMGLGKTVMMLANIVNGKASANSKNRATLIVASPALVSQWDQEIRQHCDTRRENIHGLGRVMRYHSGSRVQSNDIEDMLQSADIVLTTYTEVCRSYPKAVMPSHLVTASQKDTHWRHLWETQRGILHRVRWFRVVLDEAQSIKNHQSHTSMACRALNTSISWAVTGTPILNSIKEFYPYFKFLGEPNTGTYKIFKENFCSPDDPDGKEKLNVFLRKFMIRRTHLDTLFNARLLDLPTPRQHTLWLEFNEVERQIYEIVKKRFIQRINTMAKADNLQKKFSHIWSMILRLRQICAHPLLVFSSCLDLLEREDFEKLNAITASEDESTGEGASLLTHLRHVLKANADSETIEGGISSAVLTENSATFVDIDDAQDDTGGNHGQSFKFRKYLDVYKHTDKWEEVKDKSQCCGCRKLPEDPYVTSCDHIYCLKCLIDLQHLSARRGHDGAKCSECGTFYTSSRPCDEGFDTLEARETSTSAVDQPTKRSKAKKAEDEIDWIGIRGEILPSAKTLATKAAILEWIEEDPTVKIIVYTQWLPMIRILGKVMASEGWEFCNYTGAMSHESRDKSLTDFQQNKEKRVLLASLKAGGLGLNVTAASRVIMIDPWWNQAVEQQAFCRVFRIGQQKETRMTRVVVKNSIDAAMMSLKEKKNLEIDEVMSNSSKAKDISVVELMRLFGKTSEDEEGRPFIFVEDDGPEHLRVPNIDKEDEEQFMGNEE